MSGLSDIETTIVALFKAELADMRRLCEELRALGGKQEALRIEELIRRNQQLYGKALAGLDGKCRTGVSPTVEQAMPSAPPGEDYWGA